MQRKSVKRRGQCSKCGAASMSWSRELIQHAVLTATSGFDEQLGGTHIEPQRQDD